MILCIKSVGKFSGYSYITTSRQQWLFMWAMVCIICTLQILCTKVSRCGQMHCNCNNTSYKRKQRHCKQQWTVLAEAVSWLDKQGGSKGVGFPRCATDEDSETPTRSARKSWASWSKQYQVPRKYNNLHKKSPNTPMSRSPTKIELTQPQDIRPQ